MAQRRWDRRLRSRRALSACLLLHEGEEGRPTNVGERSALHVADALARSLDDARRIVERCAVGKLDVDVRLVRDEGDGETAQPGAARRAEPERKQVIGQVELLAGIGHCGTDDRHQRGEDLPHRGRVRGEKSLGVGHFDSVAPVAS